MKKTKELEHKLGPHKRNFESHIEKISTLMKELEGLNENVVKIQNLENVERTANEKKKEFDYLQQEIKMVENANSEIKGSIKIHQRELSALKLSISKEFPSETVKSLFESSLDSSETIENLEIYKQELQQKSNNLENESKEKLRRYETLKPIFQQKYNEINELIIKESNLSQLVSEKRKTRDKLASILKQKQESNEPEEKFDERVCNYGVIAFRNFQDEKQKIVNDFESKEKSLINDLDRKKNEIFNLNNQIKGSEIKIGEFNKKEEEIKMQIEDFKQQFQMKGTYELLIKEKQCNNEVHDRELQSLYKELTQRNEQRDLLIEQMKKSRNLIKIRDVLILIEKSEENISILQKVHQEKKEKFVEAAKFLELMHKFDLEAVNLEESMENACELYNVLINETIDSKTNIEDQIKEISSHLSINKQELSKIDEKLNSLGFSHLLKENDIPDFETQYKLLKNDLKACEKALAVSEFIKNGLTSFLLNKSKEAGKCGFCDKILTEKEIENLEKEKILGMDEPEKEHEQVLKNKIKIRIQKKNLKKRKTEYEELSRLMRNSKELQTFLAFKQNEKEKLTVELESLDSCLVEMKKTMKVYEDLLGFYHEIKNLELEKESKIKELKELEDSNPEIKQRKLTNEEKEILGNEIIFEELEAINSEINDKELAIKNHEAELQVNILEKNKMIEASNAIEGKEKEMISLQWELEKIRDSVKEFKEEFNRNSTFMKELEKEKNQIEEEVKAKTKQTKDIKEDIEKKKNEIEENLKSFSQIINNIKEKNSEIKEDMKSCKKKLENEIMNIEEEMGEIGKYLASNKSSIIEIQQDINLMIATVNLKKIQDEIRILEEKIKENSRILVQKNSALNKLKEERAKINDEKTRHNQLKDKTKWQMEEYEKKNMELNKEGVPIVDNYIQTLLDYELDSVILKDLSVYLEALEQSLLIFHRTKMEEMNKIIAETWQDVYDGDDIIKIEIKSDEEMAANKKNKLDQDVLSKKSKSYNYRIVYYTKYNKEIEMKGRCSMGQKVLAAIVIRLALAEAFGINCGILALDEPTANLDRGNVKRLAKELGRLIDAKKRNENFQLILITHDKDFVKLMNEYAEEYYEIAKNEQGWSTISKKEINFL